MGRGAIRIGPRRRFAAAAAALAGAAVLAAPALATNLLSDQQQLTQSASSPGAISPSVAYNSKKRQWLVVYQSSAGGDSEVIGERLSDLGDPIGAPFSVSNPPGAARSAFAPVVAYNRKTNHYFVAFIADALATDDEFEVFGQRLSAGGDRAGSPVRISQVGTDGDIDRRPDVDFGPAIVENPDDDQFLVAWSGDHTTDEKNEISVQRVAATGNEIGPETQVSTTPGDPERDAQAPSIAYNEESREFLVVWHQDGFAADNERDVFGQRLNAGAVPVGANDFRISETVPNGNPDSSGADPGVAANSKNGEYLVAFAAILPSGEVEIKIQVLAPDGSQVDVSDARITDVGADGDLNRVAFSPAVAFSRSAREFVVAYGADDLGAIGEYEAFAQRVGSDGEELGDNDVRVSALAPDGNPDFGLNFASDGVQPLAVAANSQLSEWLFPFAGDTAADERFDVFSRLIGLSGKCGGKVARVAGPGRDVIKLGKTRDVVAAKGGRDNVRGQGGKDRICGGKGKDRLSGGKGRDRLLGQKGKDRCLGGKGRDRAKGCERTGSI